MADGGHPAPCAVPPAPPMQPPVPPTHPAFPPVQPAAPKVQPGSMQQLNWSHFKPEFTGKPDEDVEARPLRTNNWMGTHPFQEGVKVQRFCLTLVGEAT